MIRANKIINNMIKSNSLKRNIGFSSIMSKVFGIVDKESNTYKIGHKSIFSPLEENFTEFMTPANDSKINVSKLSNGITIVTETPKLPSDINMGILLKVGTRDEDKSNSGSLLSFKNTYYKTVLNTNETINFGMVQMSGGKFNMDYDQENTLYSANCLPHDVYDIFEMMSDCAFEPKSAVTANVAIEKNEFSHNKENQFDSGINYSNTVMRVAFGKSGLSNSLLGQKSNILNLNASTLQKFQIDNISPEKIIIGATGVVNHNEFKDLVSEKLGHLQKTETNQRKPAEYVGGEYRIPSDSHSLELSLLFKGANWSDKNLLPLKLVSLINGEADVEVQKEAGDLNTGKFEDSIFSKYSFIDSIKLLNMNFSDNGLFGIKIKGDSSKSNELLEIAVNQVNELKNITQADLNKAKKLFKINYLKGIKSDSNRLEEILKNFGTYNKFMNQEILNQIEKLTVKDLVEAVNDLKKSNLTFVAEGGNVSELPSFDNIKSKLK